MLDVHIHVVHILPMSKLRKYLADTGVGQSDFAKQVKASQATVSKLINGRAVPSLSLAVRIERVTLGEISAASWVNDFAHTAAANDPHDRTGI
jgi:DNA-binding XRE family transcriptional regulator